jgi:hypothetical protein
MAEVNDEVIDDVTDVTDDNDTTDDVPEMLTEDDYHREKARREKAEKTLVEQKRRLKELESKSSETSDVFTKSDYEMEKFLDKNPDLSEYTKEIADYRKKDLSYDDIKSLLASKDKTSSNRDKLSKARVSDGDGNASSMKNEYTRAELDRIAENNPSEYAKIAPLVHSGKVKLR